MSSRLVDHPRAGRCIAGGRVTSGDVTQAGTCSAHLSTQPVGPVTATRSGRLTSTGEAGDDISVDVNAVQRQLGKRIRSFRIQAGLTQQELAQNLGLTRSSISNIEAGSQSLSLIGFLQIAEGLRVSPRELIDALTGDIDVPASSALLDVPNTYHSWVEALRRDDADDEPTKVDA